MTKFLNLDGGIYTSARDKGNGTPITEVVLFGEDKDGNLVPVKVDSQGRVITDAPKSYVKKSTDTKPTGQEGDSLYLWDTKAVFIHDGIDWREM